MDSEHIVERFRRTSLPALESESAVAPDYGGASIVAVPRLLEAAFGEACDLPEEIAQAWSAVGSGPVRRVVLLILDGLGFLRLRAAMDEVPDLYLAKLARRGKLVPLTSVFPSTTASALATLSTGVTPCEHGLLGYRLYLRETGAVTNMVRFSLHGNPRPEAAFEMGLDSDRFLEAETVYQRLEPRGVRCHVVLPRYIAGSGLSRLLYRGVTKIHAASTFSDLLVSARELFAAPDKQMITLYWGSLDAVAHAYGPSDERLTAELRALDACLRQQLAVQDGGETLLLISSDHGMTDMTPSDYVDMSSLPTLHRALRIPPVGEPRATYLHLPEGRLADA
ncbi:MAG: alkaline phosphatase family protein [Candidatus Bipolaricaulota bacterium]|nr:MAG: alkaline phosphatase family protein [Candidatus Bipolaricaulota bacterium]